MNLAQLIGGDPTSRLLPVDRLHVPTVAVVAIMTFAMTLVAAAGLALAQASATVTSAAESRIVVQLAGGRPVDTAAVRSIPGVRAVTPVSESEMRATLERWLGDAAASRDLPVPALLTVEVDRADRVAAVAKAIRAALPGAGVTTEAAELEPLLRSIFALQAVAVGLVLLMAVANGAAIVLAARGALDTHRSTVEIMHGIGATDRQVTRLFIRKIAVDALAGALGGFAIAAIVLLAIGGELTSAAGGFGSSALLAPWAIAATALVPVAAVLLVILVARWALMTSLRETL
ncbi:cell division protein [Sphingomonas sabuli]|uniref:Cell division protein n=1 Tax=Sphingomonas sabuli TaxID=2764186 RepID=A0A7G9L0G9_9SPHN|nr:FtsX-like permease family protein [Sphingomonas sabuli]QNM82118.1 cell division protein [Sphingomonas sabuli]